jgi:hypothetical protein
LTCHFATLAHYCGDSGVLQLAPGLKKSAKDRKRPEKTESNRKRVELAVAGSGTREWWF